MTDAEKLNSIKILLKDGSGYMPTDETLTEYITLTKKETLAWMYHLVGGVPEDVTEVPSKYETIQIYSVIAGWRLRLGCTTAVSTTALGSSTRRPTASM